MAWHVRGVGNFKTPAVHFDGNTLLINGALGTGDSSVVSWSYWFKAVGSENGPSTWVIDPNGNNDFNDVAGNGYFYFLGSTSTDIFDSWEIGGAYGARLEQYATNNPASDVWHHVLVSADTGGGKYGYIFIDDQEVAGFPLSAELDNRGGAFNIVAAGLPFYLGGDGESSPMYNGDIAEFWWALGQTIDISEQGRRKFISEDGKPVGLGTHGELPTGIPPTIFGHGNKDTFLQPNLGTGGDFGLSGDLTNADSSPEVGA